MSANVKPGYDILLSRTIDKLSLCSLALINDNHETTDAERWGAAHILGDIIDELEAEKKAFIEQESTS